MTQEELKVIIASDENYRIERTISTSDMDKFQEAICAFANDLSGSRKKGYLLIGVKDNGQISGLHITDDLAKKIAAIRSDGNILPLPIMSTEVVSFPDGDVLVVEVTPSFDTPIRYRGRTFVRIGPRRDIATREEERILSERCAASLPTFDTRPCREATMDDLDIDLIQKEYMPRAIDADTLTHDERSIEEQLAALRLWNIQWNCPTYAALIMFGKNPKYFMHGAYIQYVRFKGEDNGCAILNERRFEGSLLTILPLLENFIRDGIVTKRPIPVSILREKDVYNYPYKALRELLMNAVMHRDYQANMPVRFYQYDTHIEIMNPGGLYGEARPENFPNVNDYRNSVVAEIMRTMNYVNMFNHGVREVQTLLKENGNEEARFDVMLHCEAGYEYSTWSTRNYYRYRQGDQLDCRLRFALFADFGIINICPRTNNVLYDTPMESIYDFPTYRMDHVFSTRDAKEFWMRNLYVGIRFTVLFGIPWKEHCILCDPWKH